MDNFYGARRNCAISFVAAAWRTGLGVWSDGERVVCLCEVRPCPRSLSATMLDAFDLPCIINLLSRKTLSSFQAARSRYGMVLGGVALRFTSSGGLACCHTRMAFTSIAGCCKYAQRFEEHMVGHFARIGALLAGWG